MQLEAISVVAALEVLEGPDLNHPVRSNPVMLQY